MTESNPHRPQEIESHFRESAPMTCKHNRIGRVLTFEHRAVLTTYSIPHIGARFGVPVPRIVWFPIHTNGPLDKRTIYLGLFRFPKLLQKQASSGFCILRFNVMVHNISKKRFCHVFLRLLFTHAIKR